MILVNGDTLRFRAYTVAGQLYDAFDLVKGNHGASNELIERMPRGVAERTHENTLPYARPEEGGGNELEGTVENVGAGFVEVGGTRYLITEETVFEEGNPASLREGIIIEIAFAQDEDGTFVATQIEMDDEEHDVRDISGAVTSIETIDDRTFVIVGGTRLEIVPGVTEFHGIAGIEGLVVDQTVVEVDYVLNAKGDGLVSIAVRAEQ